MKFKLAALCISFLALTGCDKVQSLTGSKVACNDQMTKELVVNSFNKKLEEFSADRVKELIAAENITVDMGKVRSALHSLKVQVNNVRTTNTDPNSKKVYCVTEFTVQMPENIIQVANEARELYGQTNIAQSAVLSDLSFENNVLKKDLDYSAQPTDDGKTVYVELENPDAIAFFLTNVVTDSLIKSARQNKIEIANQEAQQLAEQEAKNAQEYQELLLAEADVELQAANKNLNTVWNATTKEVRSQLLDEQKIWLKKRDLECKLESTEYENPEVARKNCETNMTNDRTHELRNKIYYLE